MNHFDHKEEALVEILAFLAGSVAHSFESLSLQTLKDIHEDSYLALSNAIKEDGFDIGENFGLFVSNINMVIGRVSRHIFVAHLFTSEFNQSSIDYVVEKSDLFGRFHRP